MFKELHTSSIKDTFVGMSTNASCEKCYEMCYYDTECREKYFSHCIEEALAIFCKFTRL